MYVGKYSPKKRGGNSPNNIIDEKLQGGGSTLFFPNDIGVHQFMMIFHEYDFKAVSYTHLTLPPIYSV